MAIARLTIDLAVNLAGFESDMGRAARLTEKQTRSMERQITSFAKRAGLLLGAGLVTGFVAATKAAADFEKSIAEVSTLLDDTSSLDSMTDSVKSLAKEFGQAPTAQAEALYQIISSGAEAGAEATDILTASNKLAVGGLTDLKTSADGLTTILNVYGTQAGTAADVSDKLFAAMKAGKTTIGELSSGIGQAIGTAEALGVSFDELVAAGSTLASTGITTKQAFTSLRQVFANILEPQGEAAKLAEELGLNFGGAALESRTFAELLDDVAEATNGNLDQMAKLFGSVESLEQVFKLTGSAADQFKDTLAGVQNSAGETEKAVAKIAETVSFAFDRLKSAISVELIETGTISGFASAINALADNIDLLLNSIKALVSFLVGSFIVKALQAAASIKTLVASIGVAKIAIAGMLGVVGLLALAAGSVITAYQRISEIMREANKDIVRGTDLLYGQATALKALGDAGGLAVLQLELSSKLRDIGEQAQGLERELLAARNQLDYLSRTGEGSGAAIAELEDKIEGLEIALRNAQGVFNATRAELRETDDALTVSGGAISSFVSDVLGLSDALGGAAALSVEEFEAALKGIVDAAFPVEALVRQFELQVGVLDRALAAGLITQEQYTTSLAFLSDRLGEASAAAGDAGKEFKGALENILAGVDPIQALVGVFEKQVAVLNQALAEGVIGPELYQQALNHLSDELGIAASSANKAAKEFDRALDTIIDAVDPAQKLVAEFEDQVKLLNEALKKGKVGPEQYQRAVNFLSDALGEAVKASDAFGNALQGILDAAFPVEALVRTFEAQVNLLSRALDEGRITQERYQAALNHLSNALGQAAKASMQATDQIVTDADRMREATLEGIRQMTDAFGNMWTNILTGAENSFDGIKDAFAGMISNLLRSATTDKIQLQFEAAFGEGGGGFGALNFGELGKSFGAIAAAEFSDDIIQGLFGDASTEDYVEIGKQIGTVVGAVIGSLIPVIGTALGAALGSIAGAIDGLIFGKLFGRKFFGDIAGAIAGREANPREDAQAFATALGEVIGVSGRGGFGDFADPDTPAGAIKNAIEIFDKAIFDLLSAVGDSEALQSIVSDLETWRIQVADTGTAIEDIIGSRLDTVLQSFSSELQDFVKVAEGVEDQISRLGIGLSAQKLFEEAPQLFGDRTLTEFLAVLEAVNGEFGDLAETLQTLAQQLLEVGGLIAFLDDFATSDLAGDFDAIIAAQNRSIKDALGNVTNQLFDALADFDGSTEGLQQIAGLVATVREGEIQYLTELNQLQKGLNASLDELRADILGLTAPPQTGQDLIEQAGNLLREIGDATSGAEIAALQQQFNAIIRSIDTEDATFRQIDILNLIDRFQSAANDAIEGFRADALANADSTRDAIAGFVDRVGDPLDIIAATNERAAAALEAIAGTSEVEPFGAVEQISGTPIDGAIGNEAQTAATNQQLADDLRTIQREGNDNLALILSQNNSALVNAMIYSLQRARFQVIVPSGSGSFVNN